MKNKINNLLKKIICKALNINVLTIFLVVIVIIFSVFTTEILYQPKSLFKRGFFVELTEDGKVVKKEEKPVDLASLMAIADVNKGAKIFKKCASCHTIGKGEMAKVGPNLYGVVNRPKGSNAGFEYSVAMKNKGGKWDIESINGFITKPKEYVSGTKMAFSGLKKPQDRADVIAYLKQNSQ
ncbi:MAG: cytochrome c family protein [Rickettsiales bacterium]|nr:cytochrome c family protein [Rickettsiales bacterium]